MVKNKLNNCQASRHGPCDEVQVRDQQMGVSLSPVLAQQAGTLSIHQACWLFFSFFSPFSFLSFSTETVKLIWNGDGSRTASSTFTHLLSFFKCCFTSTETIRLIWDGDGSRKATSTYTPPPPSPGASSNVALRHRNRKAYQGRGAQDGHLDSTFTQFLSIFKCCFQSQLLVQTTLFTCPYKPCVHW